MPSKKIKKDDKDDSSNQRKKRSDQDPSQHTTRITKKALQPITKAESKLDEELKKVEVENTNAGD
jgi:hypothetical protein